MSQAETACGIYPALEPREMWSWSKATAPVPGTVPAGTVDTEVDESWQT
jgi:hypothetical protein